jgi:hypothetical protein
MTLTGHLMHCGIPMAIQSLTKNRRKALAFHFSCVLASIPSPYTRCNITGKLFTHITDQFQTRYRWMIYLVCFVFCTNTTATLMETHVSISLVTLHCTKSNTSFLFTHEHYIFKIYFSFFFCFLTVLGFEFRVLHLLGRCSIV